MRLTFEFISRGIACQNDFSLTQVMNTGDRDVQANCRHGLFFLDGHVNSKKLMLKSNTCNFIWCTGLKGY